ncbi:hypothetical protein AB0O67_15200 [Streptomyces sp. NPDC086077]|uniref:hypothetical protein n=1 Tax=Streptomyces sp. NPDC086077 TaxID=3154862 RepID=UPI00343F7B43
MSTPQQSRRAVRRRAWPRLLVLLLVLLLPVAHAQAAAGPVAVLAGEAVEADVLDTALRPPGRGGHRPVVAQRPMRSATPQERITQAHPAHAPTGPPYPLRTLRSVVLRC